MKQKHVWGVSFLVLGAVVWGVMHQSIPSVSVAEARSDTAINAVTGTLKINANMDIELDSEKNAKLVELPVKLGQFVKKGDIVARFDSEDLRLRLQELEVKYQAAKKRLDLPSTYMHDLNLAEADIEKTQQMLNAGMASEVELKSKEIQMSKQRAWFENERIGREELVSILEIQKKQIENELDKLVIRAPWDGEIVEIFAFPGDFLHAGNRVVRLVSSGRWIEMTVAEEDFYGIEKGQKAMLHLAGYPDEAIEARVTGTAKFADADKKTRNVYLLADKSDDFLVPGFTGEGVIVKNERPDTVIIPRRALIGNKVYVVVGDRIEIRQVKPGYLGLDKAEILKGIEVGDLVVLEDQAALYEGMRVNPDDLTR